MGRLPDAGALGRSYSDGCGAIDGERGTQMFARVSTYQVPEAEIDAAIEGFDRAKLDQFDGVLGAYVLADRGGGRLVSITLWESEAALEASAAAAKRIRSETMEQASGAVADVDVYEVVLEEDFRAARGAG
jgi:heme-degrading monooxygenase HmoA